MPSKLIPPSTFPIGQKEMRTRVQVAKCKRRVVCQKSTTHFVPRATGLMDRGKRNSQQRGKRGKRGRPRFSIHQAERVALGHTAKMTVARRIIDLAGTRNSRIRLGDTYVPESPEAVYDAQPLLFLSSIIFILLGRIPLALSQHFR